MRKGTEMSILNRIQRIAKANFNWLLDKAEPPEAELEARIVELQDTITEGKVAAATYGATFRQLEKEAESLKERQEEFLLRASQSVEAGDDDAARKFLAEKVSLEERITNLQPGVEEGRKTWNYLRENLTMLQDQLKKTKLKLAELKSRQRAADARKVFGESAQTVGSAVDAGAMFERMEQQVMQTEAEAEVMEDMHGDIDLEQRSRELQIESELAALKQKSEDGK